jgi:hypothetical protein
MLWTSFRRAAVGCLFASLAAGAAILAVTDGARAVTANTSAYTILAVNEDRFRNWDFHCGNADSCITRTNVDWPMVLLFYNNAEINKVKDNILAPRYDQGSTCASAQYARVNDGGSNWRWDEDSGKKTTCCPGAPFQPDTAGHIRFYSNGRVTRDRMYNSAWGYWILASDHQDHNEPQCTDNPAWFGYTETEEANVYNYWVNDLGRPATHNQQFWYNQQNDDQGSHYVRSNGYTSVFWVG